MLSAGWVLSGLVVYAGVMVAIGLAAQRNVQDVEDYVVAGRRLGLGLATPTLLATWFGAGTLLIAADEVREQGLSAAALDPLGAGVCLILAGLLIARPLWELRLLTLPDFYGRAYGPLAERAAALLMVPAYLGWIAAQFYALAGILTLYVGLDPAIGLAVVGVFGVLYTLAGGMWAVTLTDAVQVALLILGLVLTVAYVLAEGGGLLPVWSQIPPAQRELVPAGTGGAFAAAFAAGALGNLPGQDLTQRIFAARSASVARWACLLAGGLYLTIGALPVLLGLAADVVFAGAPGQSILPALATSTLPPALGALFLIAVISAVLSTIDSAILAPATTIAHNLVAPLRREAGGASLREHQASAVGVGAVSLGIAYLGEDAWSLLETSYEIGMVSLLAPLLLGIWRPTQGQLPALLSMALGTGGWTLHMLLGVDGFLGTALPQALGCLLLATLPLLLAPRALTPVQPTPP